MGQQQLLLIILGVIVVGIAVAVGITMFNDSAVSANRDAVINDLVNLASRAQQYYRRPTALGGGNASYVNLTTAGGMKLLTKTSTSSWTNGNGTYTIATAGTGGSTAEVDFQGLGTSTGNDGTNPVKVIMQVWADSAKVNVALTN
jgi:Tfp pilus assembly protein PilE